jgi:hypothetical protein
MLIPRQSTRTKIQQLNLPRSKIHDVVVYKMLGDHLLPTLAVGHQVDGP